MLSIINSVSETHSPKCKSFKEEFQSINFDQISEANVSGICEQIVYQPTIN